jgi:prepilin-type N-terminal cleavage/methylation domain-containing protein
MLTPAERRLHTEGGFTLIELLVVMIIIAILMAVAVPTFLKQKQSAVATKAKANITQVKTAIESCASGNVSGLINSNAAGERQCVTIAELQADEPSLTPLFDTSNPEHIVINPIAGGAGYTIVANYIAASGTPATFTYENDGSGNITKTCVQNADTQKSCPTGTWS